jgi:hypothetical protein
MVQQLRVRAGDAIWDAWTAPGRSDDAALSMPPAPVDLNSLSPYKQASRRPPPRIFGQLAPRWS